MGEEKVLAELGPLRITGGPFITSTVITMWAIVAILALVSFLATRRLKKVPGPVQSLAELAVEKLQNFFGDSLGQKNMRKYFPVFATFFIFIVVSNYSGQLPGMGHVQGMALPTAHLSVTAGLGVLAFCTTHVIGVKERGLGHYLASFAKPFVLCILMLPLNLIEQFVRPMSLALRLYGNMYGEEMVTEQLYEILPVVAPLIMNILSLLFCLLQAMVFTMLLSIYVSEAAENEEE